MKKQQLLNICIAAALAAIFASCKSSTAPEQSNLIPLSVRDTISIASGDRALFIVNEGSYPTANASLDVIVFHAASSVVDTLVHVPELSGMGGGNDILVSGNKLLLVDNGSNLVDVGSVTPLQSMSGIPVGLDAPNKMALIGANLLLVTRRLATSAAIIDLTTNTITDSIPLGGVSVAVAVLNNKAYITTGASEYSGPYHLNVVDLSTRQVTKTFNLPLSGEQALPDSSSGNIIIGMSGDGTTTSSKLYFINATSDVITDSLTPGTPADDPELTTGSKHFIVMGTNVYPLAVPTHQLPAPIVRGTVAYYKGMYDATSDALYLGNAGDFTNPGSMDVYSASTGKLLWSHPAGIAPGHFAFYH